MNRIFRLSVVALIILSLFQIQMKPDKNRPLWDDFFGDPSRIEWSEEEGIWINHNYWVDNCMWVGLPYKEACYWIAKCKEPRRIPVEKVLVIKLREGYYRRPETYTTFCMAVVLNARGQGRFLLVNPDKTPNYEEQYKHWPHLGLLAVGTVAHEEGYDVVLWDELIQGHANLEELIKPGDIFGLSLLVSGMERGVELARQAKQLGARYVVAGNDAAIFRASQLLKLPDKPIDVVFTSNSTNAIRQFFREISYRGLSDLSIAEVATLPEQVVSHSNESASLEMEFQRRKEERPDRLDGFVVPKLDLYSQSHWERVWYNYRSQYGHKHLKPERLRGALIHLAQGCTRTQGKEACTYCGIFGVADVRVPSEAYLARLLERYEAFGVNNLYNATDSAYEMYPLIKQLRNVGFHTDNLQIYGRALGLADHPKLLEVWLSFVNDRLLINCGMDSGDEQILQQGIIKAHRKGGSRLHENRQAILKLRGKGAHLYYSCIFGSPGETRESCERTLDFIGWSMAELGMYLDLVETDIYWLNFGSAASRVFHDFEYAQQLAALAGKSITREQWENDFAQHADALSVPWSAQKSWYQRFTHIDVDVAYEYNDRSKLLNSQHPGHIAPRDFAFKPPEA